PALEPLVDHPGVTQEDVEAAVRSKAQIDDAPEAGGERLRLGRGGGLEGANPAVVEVAEEVLAAVFPGPREVPGCAGATANARRGVVVDGAAIAGVGSRTVLHGRPAVIGSREALVDLLRPAAHVVEEQPTGFRLDGEGERVAQAERPDRSVLAGRSGREGI